MKYCVNVMHQLLTTELASFHVKVVVCYSGT